MADDLYGLVEVLVSDEVQVSDDLVAVVSEVVDPLEADNLSSYYFLSFVYPFTCSL
ncbi:MAG: hypothetical protein WCJ45_02640 [bacterium]